jgi:hypothetical protein
VDPDTLASSRSKVGLNNESKALRPFDFSGIISLEAKAGLDSLNPGVGVGGTGAVVGDGLDPQPLTARARVKARNNGKSFLILFSPSLAWMFTVAFGIRRVSIGQLLV